MGKGKKILNILGILVSIVLSITLVVILVVTPLLVSTLSLLKPENLGKTVAKMDMVQVMDVMAEEAGEDLEGEEAEVLKAFLSTKAAKKIVQSLTTDVAHTLAGTGNGSSMTVEAFRDIVNENMDEIAQALRSVGGEFATMSDQELQDGIRENFVEGAENILEELPTPQQVKESLMEQSPELEQAMKFMGMIDTLIMGLVMAISVLCLIIFVCRLFDWRGFKWLAVDLLIAGILSGVICVFMSLNSVLLEGITQSNALVESLVGSVIGTLSTGMIVRTAIMVGVAVSFLVVYLVIRNARKKKTAPVAPVVQAVVEPQPPENPEPKQ